MRATPARSLLAPLLVLGSLVASAGPADAGSREPTTEIVDSTGQDGLTGALTFDDGPDPANTPRLLDLLLAQGHTAVFCLWGEHARRYPDLVRRIVADGHVLCNHSMNHQDLGTWTPDQIRADLLNTNAAIRAAVPQADIRYFCAPYGSWGQTPAVAAELGMQPLGWRLAVGDWEPPGTDELVRRLLEGITPGAVVLLHDGGGDRGQTVDAVARVVPELRAAGWRFTLPARPGSRHVES
ncbi:MAG: polysaccharide deacetylase family protein [Actinophytocola sp.]|uniref:polysaccharide deacetylase family protein n=1 Tax=Actinophytocola sp. TaxID=1872138 RepID=UPI0013234653|nr:polysaccharide deacetylase family protein [Actinophytocola sp.]MPZ86219.1 polysaccharide deacetylase family protein [Actinophytocola sp.]